MFFIRNQHASNHRQMDLAVSCSCGWQHRLLGLLFCSACHELKCESPRCTQAQPEVYYCPSCWKASSAMEAARTGLRCPTCGVGPTGAGDSLACVSLLRRCKLLHDQAQSTQQPGQRAAGTEPLERQRPAPGSGEDFGRSLTTPVLELGATMPRPLPKRSAIPLRSVGASDDAGSAERGGAGAGACPTASTPPVEWVGKSMLSQAGTAGASSAAGRSSAPDFAAEAYERKRLAAQGWTLGPSSSAGPTTHAMVEAAVSRALGRHPRRSGAGDGETGPEGPLEAGQRVAGELRAQRAASMLGSPSLGGSAASGAAVTPVGTGALTLGAPLRCMVVRRCCACVQRGDSGILTAPSPAPLALLARGGIPERGLGAWFRKTSPAATLLPRIEVLPRHGETGSSATSLQAALRSALQAALGISAPPAGSSAEASPLVVEVPVMLRITNPGDQPLLLALTCLPSAHDLMLPTARGLAVCALSLAVPAAAAPAAEPLAYLEHPEPVDEGRLTPAAAFGALMLRQATRSGATPGPAGGSAESHASAAPLAVVSVGAFDELSLDELRSESEEAEAAEVDARELLGVPSAADDAGCDAGSEAGAGAGAAGPASAWGRWVLSLAHDTAARKAVHTRWRHVVSLAAALRLSLPAAAVAEAAARAAALSMPPPILRCQLDLAASVLFPPAALAHRAGTAAPPPAAAAAGNALLVQHRLAFALPLPCV